MGLREISVQHPNGRCVHALVMGEPRCGQVIVYHHGFPACRLEAMIARKFTQELGVCIVAIDRPGIGRSHWYENRTLEDWPDDVAIVMDSLGVDSFAVMAVSGGTPSSIALTARMPHRVVSLTVVSGVAPMHLPGALDGVNRLNRFFMRLSSDRPTVGKTVMTGVAIAWKKLPTLNQIWFGMQLPAYDRAALQSMSVAVPLRRSTIETFKGGVKGVVTDFQLLASRWEPLLSEVRVPTAIWHGDSDTYVPLAMGRILHERVSGSCLHVIEGGGHFMVVQNLGEILTDIVTRSWARGTRDARAT
jgi:pimeloyl-ACP methyl ester carboxylesterase